MQVRSQRPGACAGGMLFVIIWINLGQGVWHKSFAIAAARRLCRWAFVCSLSAFTVCTWGTRRERDNSSTNWCWTCGIRSVLASIISVLGREEGGDNSFANWLLDLQWPQGAELLSVYFFLLSLSLVSVFSVPKCLLFIINY